jgi:hypothetical protein
MIHLVQQGWGYVAGVILFILFLIGGYYMMIHNSCDGWEYGFGGAKIDNSIGECKILRPNY